ncbi:MAG: prenyltransferase [Chloroflexi bacterium]|nr:prenyltransferase [Chloroflexota bacterium]
MARPLIMLSVVHVYVAGTLIARAYGHPLNVAAFVCGLIVLLLVALSIHYTNEYADYETDAITQRTLFSGGSGILPAGIVPRSVALWAAWITLGMGSVLVVVAIALGALSAAVLPVLAIGAWGGWMYSLPPLKLAWRGWGELDNALLGGIVLSLYGYVVQSDQFDWRVVLGCLPFTGLAFLNLLATTWVDRRADAQVGKRTLATRWSPTRLRRLYTVVALLSFGLLVLLHDHVLPPEVIAASLLALPFVAWGILRYTRTEAPHHSVFAMLTLLSAQMLAWIVV